MEFVNKLKNRKTMPFFSTGFTALEILISIAVMLMLVSIISSVFSDFNRNQALETETASIVSLLEKARLETVGNKDATNFGVHFETGKAVRFQGSSYSSTNPSNEVQTLNPLVKISTIALAGGASDIVFAKLSGNADHPGTITISLVSEPLKTKTIMIYGTGILEYN